MNCSRNLFKKLEILPFKSQYIFSLLLFVVNNMDLLWTNSENHNIHARQSKNLYLPLANLTVYQLGDHYSGIKFFSKIPLEIKNITGNLKNLRGL